MISCEIRPGSRILFTVARLLIIDDDVTVTLTLARMLEFEGHVVEAVESAQAALDALDRQLPDAIILDMRMPGMGGLEFLRRVRAAPATTGVPVGVVTGDYFLKDAVLEELATLGAVLRYKPLWLDDLSALTRALLGQRAAEPQRS